MNNLDIITALVVLYLAFIAWLIYTGNLLWGFLVFILLFPFSIWFVCSWYTQRGQKEEIGEKNNLTKDDKDTLLIEYQKAQDSAEHHDRLLWEVIAIFFAGMLVLLGLTSSFYLKAGREMYVLMISLFAIFASTVFLLFAHWFRKVVLLKYKRCRKIEGMLGMSQHRKVHEEYKGCQWPLLIILVIVMIVIWILIILGKFCFIYFSGNEIHFFWRINETVSQHCVPYNETCLN